MILRVPIAVIASFIITTVCFHLMHSLIVGQNSNPPKEHSLSRLTLFQPAKATQQQSKMPTPSPTKPQTLAPNILPAQLNLPPKALSPVKISPSALNNDYQFAKVSLDSLDIDYLPTKQIPPLYPPRAHSRGIEGYTLIEYTITPEGDVIDAVVLESSPPRVFDKASLNAITNFKFKPRMVKGQPISVTGVQKRFVFKLENN